MHYILEGILHGFRVGFNYARVISPSLGNLPSVTNHPQAVQQYIANEVTLGRLVGPLVSSEAVAVHCSPIGIIPKQHKPGKWRLIHDLSSPEGASINDGISPDLSSLTYVTVDQVAQDIVRLSPGTLLAKLDVKSAYRIVPVHADDRSLLGLSWEGNVYVDSALPFGLRSACKIFSAFSALADALQWVVLNELQDPRGCLYHYLDDFVCLSPPDSSVCGAVLAQLMTSCDFLGIPIAAEKLEGPATCLSFLGVEIDMMTMQVHLPPGKLERLLGLCWRPSVAG